MWASRVSRIVLFWALLFSRSSMPLILGRTAIVHLQITNAWWIEYEKDSVTFRFRGKHLMISSLFVSLTRHGSVNGLPNRSNLRRSLNPYPTCCAHFTTIEYMCKLIESYGKTHWLKRSMSSQFDEKTNVPDSAHTYSTVLFLRKPSRGTVLFDFHDLTLKKLINVNESIFSRLLFPLVTAGGTKRNLSY